ncbi:MAG: M3 family oligoendopeptidase [Clostridiales bacterium]|jgi:pepF/M3 family oligoendopeptidase|nr:M3 family oligoendopeptidase [Clostridiales bacterium]
MEMLWNLDDLYTSFESPEFLADFEAVKKEVADLTAWTVENFADSENAGEKLTTYINRVNGNKAFMKLYCFAMLTRSVEDGNEAAKKYMDLLGMLHAEFTRPEVLFKAYVGKIDDLDGLIAAHPVLKEHEFILREIKAKSEFLLSEAEEVVFAKMRNTGSRAWNDMKEQLTATLRIPVMVEGEEKILPLPAVRNLAYEKNPETRKNAYFAELKAYEEIDKAVAASLNSIKGEVLTNVAMRGYESPLHMTLVNSRMETQTLEAMISSMEDFLPSFRRYFKKKAEILGHEGALPWYDLFAPVGEVDMRFTWQEAMDFTLEQFYTFSQKLGDFTKHAFDNRWTDVPVREGKRGGAFCMNIHAIGQSRVMMNFDGSFSNVTTLAHEYGHAYHGDCLNDVSSMNSSYTMPIAETASNFCETIIVDAAMQKADDNGKFVILEQVISDAMQVVVDIYSRYLFETRLFEKRAGGPLSVDEINELMLAAQKDAYGDGLDHGVLHKYMWINKPHYYYPDRNFYNFPYAYGMMFSQGLYAQYLAEGESFVPKYDKLLAATGSASLEQVGDLAGIDVRKKDFWTQSLKLIEAKIDEFCKFGK